MESEAVYIPPPQAGEADPGPDPLLGLWHDYADEMDEIVADAYRQRGGNPGENRTLNKAILDTDTLSENGCAQRFPVREPDAGKPQVLVRRAGSGNGA